jgi:hypothetical protein
MQKTILPPEPKPNQTKRRIQSKMPTTPKVENPMFYEMSLDKPQDMHRPLKQQSKSNPFQM